VHSNMSLWIRVHGELLTQLIFVDTAIFCLFNYTKSGFYYACNQSTSVQQIIGV
jgi:hypothetical protein